MTTLLNLANKIGIENQTTLRVILSNYETDKLFDTLPRFIINLDTNDEHHIDLRTLPSSNLWELRYVKRGQEALLLVHGYDLRQTLINMIIDIILFRIEHEDFKCNNEF